MDGQSLDDDDDDDDDGSQVFEALNSFKLFATDLDGTADAVDVIRHQLGLLCTDLHAICG